MDLRLNCSKHKQNIQAYCENCNQFVCTQCIINSSSSEHRGHSFLSLNDTAMRLRELIKENSPLLKKDYTEEVELRIRYAKVEYKSLMQEFLMNIEGVFDNLLNKIKDRKKLLMKTIEDEVIRNINTFIADEEKWKDKYTTAKKIVEYGTLADDATILLNKEEITNGLTFLKERLNVRQVPVYTDYKLNLKLEDHIDIAYKDLECLISNMISFEDPIYIEYKA